VERLRDWVEQVNESLKPAQLERLRQSLERGRPFGDDEWVTATAKKLGLTNTIRPVGRPPKKAKAPGAPATENQ
jgi:putative transposase